MHKLYKPGTAPKDYNFEEYCSECDAYIPVVIDEDDTENYQYTCPCCGHRLMLCTLCHWDHGDCCDWCQEHGCHMMKRTSATA